MLRSYAALTVPELLLGPSICCISPVARRTTRTASRARSTANMHVIARLTHVWLCPEDKENSITCKQCSKHACHQVVHVCLLSEMIRRIWLMPVDVSGLRLDSARVKVFEHVDCRDAEVLR